MKNHSLFSFGPGINPYYYFDKWFNPYYHRKTITFRKNQLTIEWTKRADHALSQSTKNLIVEMQLYFSCVVKKRVLFTEQADFQTISVKDNLSVAFHPVEAASCDPIEFAKNFPARHEFDSVSAKKMRPRELKIDYKNNAWQGEFYI